MNKIFEKIKKYYDNNLWTLEQVKNAVVRGKITAEEYTEITAEEYVPNFNPAPSMEERFSEINERIEFVEDCLIEMSETVYGG